VGGTINGFWSQKTNKKENQVSSPNKMNACGTTEEARILFNFFHAENNTEPTHKKGKILKKLSHLK
jgi:hypothetical protein